MSGRNHVHNICIVQASGVNELIKAKFENETEKRHIKLDKVQCCVFHSPILPAATDKRKTDKSWSSLYASWHSLLYKRSWTWTAKNTFTVN